MKTALRISALVLVVAMLSVMLVSCSILTGTYGAEILGISVTYEFKLGGKVIITSSALGVSTSFEGKYKIEDDKITISFEDEDDKATSVYAGTSSYEKGKDDDGNAYIKIGDVTLTKK